MDVSLLEKLGLTSSQAKTYIALIKAGSLTPPQLAIRIKESRTAAYMALGKLEEIGLAKRVESAKKQTFAPANPSALQKFIAKRREEVARAEDQYHEAMPNLLSYYFTHRPEPGVRFFQGEDGLEKIYEDHLRTREFVYVLRTPADDGHFGQLLYRYMDKRSQMGIHSEILGPGRLSAIEYSRKNDARLKRTSSWYPVEAYKAPVEISIYGNKVSYISFGKEAIGMIIESPQIAEAMREVYAMSKIGAAELMRRCSKPA
jgi:sugar-specific transcriptional regulator TrmB